MPKRNRRLIALSDFRLHRHVKLVPSFLSVDRHSSTNNMKSSVSGGCSLTLPVMRKGNSGKVFSSTGVCTYPGGAIESQSHTTEEKIGVMLLNLGGPDTLDDVQPFLFNLFADPVWFTSNTSNSFNSIVFRLVIVFNSICYRTLFVFPDFFGSFSVLWHN